MQFKDGINWTPDMLETLACNLQECCTHVRQACHDHNHGEEGVVQLSYREDIERYSALIRFGNKRYYECNFQLDFGGGTPYPYQIEQYNLPRAEFLCSLDFDYTFITE